MKTINKIYIVGALHGDEVFGLKVLGHLEYLSNPKIITKVGHPEAVAKRQEFLETDLNRSFDINVQSKEGIIAKSMVRDITRHQPDLILDIHTCEANVGKVGILARHNIHLVNLAQNLSMDQVVVMPRSISEIALLGQFPDKTIVLELGKNYRSDSLAQTLARNIASLCGTNMQSRSQDIDIYFVKRTIRRDEVGNLELTNYVFNENLGGYPFLVGKNSYIEYAGFLASKKSE